MTAQNILLGVSHVDEKRELRQAKTIIKYHNPVSVGLELPTDYLQRQEDGIKTLLFSELAAYLVGEGRAVIPLEDKALWDRRQAIELAKAVLEGRIKREDLEEKLYCAKKIIERTSYYTAPELFLGLHPQINKYQTALEILKEAPTLLDILPLWSQSNKQREQKVLNRIIASQPSMVIIGDAHAHNLMSCLSKYRYSALSESVLSI